jgi:hypothetical protein
MSGGQTPRPHSDKPLEYMQNIKHGTTCPHHMPHVVPYVVAVVEVYSLILGRHHPFARAIKQCSVIVKVPVRRAECKNTTSSATARSLQ